MYIHRWYNKQFIRWEGGRISKEEVGGVLQNVKIMKEVDHMLGIKVKKVKEGLQISQKAYVNQILEKFGIISSKPKLILLLVSISLSSSDELETKKEKNEIKNISY